MRTVDRIIVFLAILFISILIFYLLYFFTNTLVVDATAVIVGIAGFLLGLFEFFRKR